jgi:hypothetical protein
MDKAIAFGYWVLLLAMVVAYCLWLLAIDYCPWLWILATSYKYLHNGLLWVQLLAMDKG